MSRPIQLKVGDRVKVVRRESKPYWSRKMEKSIGSVLTVVGFVNSNPLLSNGYYYNRKSLRKIPSKSK